MSKAEAGEVKWSKSKLKKTKSTLEFHKVSRIVLGESLKKFTTLVPHLSEIIRISPLKIIRRKVKLGPPLIKE